MTSALLPFTSSVQLLAALAVAMLFMIFGREQGGRWDGRPHFSIGASYHLDHWRSRLAPSESRGYPRMERFLIMTRRIGQDEAWGNAGNAAIAAMRRTIRLVAALLLRAGA